VSSLLKYLGERRTKQDKVLDIIKKSQGDQQEILNLIKEMRADLSRTQIIQKENEGVQKEIMEKLRQICTFVGLRPGETDEVLAFN
jgi:hypothetical protein